MSCLSANAIQQYNPQALIKDIGCSPHQKFCFIPNYILSPEALETEPRASHGLGKWSVAQFILLSSLFFPDTCKFTHRIF